MKVKIIKTGKELKLCAVRSVTVHPYSDIRFAGCVAIPENIAGRSQQRYFIIFSCALNSAYGVSTDAAIIGCITG